MSEKITERVNGSLNKIFNTDDIIYKALVCDKTGIPEISIVRPTDFNLGEMTNLIEYLRRLSIDLLKQMYIDQAEGDFLNYTLETFFKNVRLENESEAQWVSRAMFEVFTPKVSRASIIYALRQYSSLEPEIISGSRDSMFADVSFADRYRRYNTTFQGQVFQVFPSYGQTEDSSLFSVIIILYDTPSSSFFSVASLITKFLAAGIDFILEIRYT